MKPVVVGVDIRDLRVAKTGQKTTLEELCNQFRLINRDDITFHFFDTVFPVYSGRNKLFLILSHIQYHIWKQITLPIKAWIKGCDIVFCADYFAPYAHLGFKTIQVFHDAFFYEHPQHYNKIWHYIFKYIGMPAARRSAFIIVPTNYAREKIHFYMDLPKEKLITVYEGPKTLNVSTNAPEPEWLRKLGNERYILHVGVMEKRKNLPMLIRSFKKLIDNVPEKLKLVLVGKGNGRADSDDTVEIYKAIADNKLEKDVVFPGYLSDEELSLAYKNAFMYVFPSFNEGFGIPLLEAFRFNLPVIVSNNSCLPEVGGNGVLTFDPFSEQDIYEKMKLIIEDESVRNTLKKNGTLRLQHFSWRKTSEQLSAIFKDTARS